MFWFTALGRIWSNVHYIHTKTEVVYYQRQSGIAVTVYIREAPCLTLSPWWTLSAPGLTMTPYLNHAFNTTHRPPWIILFSFYFQICSSRSAGSETVRESCGCLVSWSHFVYLALWIPSVLWWKRREPFRSNFTRRLWIRFALLGRN